jgi:elongation factor G
MVAEADETLMEKFFEAGTLTQEQLVAGLRAATASGKLFPLLCTSATLNIGVQPLLDAIVGYVPSPADRALKMTDPKTGEGASAAVLG